MSATLIKMEMSGFCGIRGTQTLRLDRPLTVLVGPNGSGKSTVAMAIEWALFGVAHAVTEAGIAMSGNAQHAAYIHHGLDEARVALTFRQDDNTEFVYSRIRARRQPDPKNDRVAVTDGSRADPVSLFNMTGDVYRRVVAPAQSIIQSIVAGDGKERDSALDRLFGIDGLNAAVGGSNKAVAKVSAEVTRLTGRWTAVQERLQAEADRRFEVRDLARRAALDAGARAEDLTLTQARAEAGELSATLSVQPPAIDAATDGLLQHVGALRSAAASAFATPAAAAVLHRVQIVRGHVSGPRDAWQRAIVRRRVAETALGDATVQYGSVDAIRNRIVALEQRIKEQDLQIKATSRHAAVLLTAQEWLDEQQDGDVKCPVCQSPSVKMELSRLVDAKYAELDGPDGTLAGLRNEKTATVNAASALRADLDRVQAAESALQTAASDVACTRGAMIAGTGQAAAVWLDHSPDPRESEAVRVCGETATAGLVLRDGIPPDAPACEEACDALVRALLLELDRLETWARSEIAGATERAQTVLRRVDALAMTLRFLVADASLDALDAVRQNEALVNAQRELQKGLAWQSTLTTVRDVLGEASLETAEAIVGTVRPRLLKAFEQMSYHEKLTRATLAVATTRPGGYLRNAYSIRAEDADGTWSAGGAPRLSGGYQMALALSALHALASGDPPLHGLGLLVLDEPNERLDADLQRRAASLLVTHPPARRVLVTTVDAEFAQVLTEVGGAANVTRVDLGRWTADGGTVIPGGV